MELGQLVHRIQDIETEIHSLFDDHFKGMDKESSTFVAAPMSPKAVSRLHAWLRNAKIDFAPAVIETLVNMLTVNGLHNSSISTFVSLVASRLQTTAYNVHDAIVIWEKICKARYEACQSFGGLNKEELWRYRAHIEGLKDTFLKEISTARICIQEINDLINKETKSSQIDKVSTIRCPITSQSCDKVISPMPSVVFCAYQFDSNYYKTKNLKTMITESLEKFNLQPFFPDDHYEPIHISCKICHTIQRVSICIFEISDSNPNVMFELGLAYMLGKVAILLAHQGSPGTKISDVAGIHRVLYDDLVDCREFIIKSLNSSSLIRSSLTSSEGGKELCL